jgi:hypothetical protein
VKVPKHIDIGCGLWSNRLFVSTKLPRSFNRIDIDKIYIGCRIQQITILGGTYSFLQIDYKSFTKKQMAYFDIIVAILHFFERFLTIPLSQAEYRQHNVELNLEE